MLAVHAGFYLLLAYIYIYVWITELITYKQIKPSILILQMVVGCGSKLTLAGRLVTPWTGHQSITELATIHTQIHGYWKFRAAN